MYINGKWLTEPEIEAKFKLLEKENAELKRLLKAAVEDIQDILCNCDSMTVCVHCIHAKDICYGGADCEHEAVWEHLSEALALIGEDTNVPATATDTNVGGKGGAGNE